MTRKLRVLAGIGLGGLVLNGAGCGHCRDWEPLGPSVIRGSGVLATESWEVAGFSAISVGGGVRLIVERTGAESVTVTSEDNILGHLAPVVVGERLVLGPQRGVSVSPTREIVYRVTCRELNGIFVAGASEAQATGIDSDALVVELSGASVLDVSGSARDQAVQVAGASEYRAADLASRSAALSLTGVSRGLVRVSDRLTVTASGGSLLEYLGDPELTVSASGTSLVRRVGD